MNEDREGAGRGSLSVKDRVKGKDEIQSMVLEVLLSKQLIRWNQWTGYLKITP